MSNRATNYGITAHVIVFGGQ